MERGQIQVVDRDNADVRRGDRGQREVSTLCTWHTHRAVLNTRHRLRRTRHLEMGAGWDIEVRGEASTSTGDRGSTSFWKEGMGLGIWGRGGSDNMQEQI